MAFAEAIFLLLVPIAAIVVVVLYFPKYLCMAFLRLKLYSAGMTPKTLTVNGIVYSYAEKGRNKPGTPSFLFIHGFGSSKEVWGDVIKYLPPDRHVVALDLPGHGGSSPIQHEAIHPMNQAHKVHQFARLHGLDKESFHVVGLSMGAIVAGCFAASYPTHTSHLTLCCPPISTPKRSKVQEMIDTGKIGPNLATTVDEQDKMFKLIVYKDLKIPRQVQQGLLDLRKENEEYIQRLSKELHHPEVRDQVVEHSGKIKAPTQIVWGDTDNLADVSGVEVLKKELDNCVKIDIIKECGHLILMEHPKQLADLIMALQAQ